ncbi:hypothetical protein AGMMS4952_27670 [Spirochaetia bacterium]|nr:hypothetical protein AGMMS4952_27670 [Spirochaetia bacterium]
MDDTTFVILFRNAAGTDTEVTAHYGETITIIITIIITTAKTGIGAAVMVTTIMGMTDDVSLVPRTALRGAFLTKN